MPGDQDLQAPPWVMRRQLAHIPGAKFIVLPEAAHSINWEQPEAFNRNVLEFTRAGKQLRSWTHWRLDSDRGKFSNAAS
jgi:pimeloyl-ACP methyl ester carboxylesterase